MTPFQEKVLTIVKTIPKGRVVTYKYIAQKLNSKAYRAIGSALKHNPHLITIPCHRVIQSDGSIGGYVKGLTKKIKLLESEGIHIQNRKVDLDKFGLK